MATGTTGACALIAMMKPPFLNGSSSPVRLRVPSGKMRNELPVPQRAGRAVDGRQALLGVAALERNEAGEVECPAQHRQLPQLALYRMRSRGKELVEGVEEMRRLDVAGVVDRVNGARPRWMCSVPFDRAR